MFATRTLLAAAMMAGLALPVAALADTYTQASYSGAIYSDSANVQSPFTSGFTQGDGLSGSFVYDDQQVPGGGSGWVNVFYNGYPDAAGIAPADQFNFTLDGLHFTASDNLDSLIPAGVQYNNGQFNGFEFHGDFSYQGAKYRFQLDGPIWSVYALDGVADPYDPNGEPTGGQLMGGYINTGNNALANLSSYTPVAGAAPEPAVWALMAVSVGGLGAMLRTRRRRMASKA